MKLKVRTVFRLATLNDYPFLDLKDKYLENDTAEDNMTRVDIMHIIPATDHTVETLTSFALLKL